MVSFGWITFSKESLKTSFTLTYCAQSFSSNLAYVENSGTRARLCCCRIRGRTRPLFWRLERRVRPVAWRLWTSVCPETPHRSRCRASRPISNLDWGSLVWTIPDTQLAQRQARLDLREKPACRPCCSL